MHSNLYGFRTKIVRTYFVVNQCVIFIRFVFCTQARFSDPILKKEDIVCGKYLAQSLSLCCSKHLNIMDRPFVTIDLAPHYRIFYFMNYAKTEKRGN